LPRAKREESREVKGQGGNAENSEEFFHTQGECHER
jgi:hypothetical protein